MDAPRATSAKPRDTGEESGEELRFADVVLNEATHEVRRAGARVELTPTEFNLLRFLMLNPRRVLTKRQILDCVWDNEFEGDPSIVETYISYLRKKLDAFGHPLIHTVRLVGYSLREGEDSRARLDPPTSAPSGAGVVRGGEEATPRARS